MSVRGCGAALVVASFLVAAGCDPKQPKSSPAGPGTATAAPAYDAAAVARSPDHAAAVAPSRDFVLQVLGMT